MNTEEIITNIGIGLSVLLGLFIFVWVVQGPAIAATVIGVLVGMLALFVGVIAFWTWAGSWLARKINKRK